MSEKILIGTVGLPRSGKSTWARTLNVPMVNPDSIRLGLHGQAFNQLAEPFVWATAKLMTRALFIAGHDIVVLDATNLTEDRRQSWIWPEWRTLWKIFDTPLEVCVERALAGGNPGLVPVIERFAAETTYPTAELWDEYAKRTAPREVQPCVYQP